MKKKLLSIVLLFAFPACLKRKKVETVVTPTAKVNEWKKAGEAKFDEDAEEFYLEDDEAGNVFENPAAAKPATDLDLVEVDLDDQQGEVVQFDFDSTVIKKQEMPKIERNAEHVQDVLKENKDAVVVVNGHSCKIAKSKSYNYMISQERANHVKNEYVQHGCQDRNIKAVGHGDSQPITQAKGKAGQAPNRRVETNFVKAI